MNEVHYSITDICTVKLKYIYEEKLSQVTHVIMHTILYKKCVKTIKT